MDNLLPVIVGGAIGFLSAQVSVVFQFWRDRKLHKHQLERDEKEHKRQLERDQQEYARNQADARKEQIRAGYAALLEAALAIYHFMLSYGERKKVTEGRPDTIIPLPEAKQGIELRSKQLRDALSRLDKAWIALMLLEPREQVLSEELRMTMEFYAVAIENPPNVREKLTEKAEERLEEAKRTIFHQVREL